MRYGPQDMTHMMGIGSYVGEVRRGPDGQAYQWVEGVDGLGNPIGFWKGLKRLASQAVSKALPIAKMIPGVGPIIGAVKPFCQTLPQMQPFIQQAPGIQPIYTLGNKICKVLGKVGIAGAEGAIMEAPDGQLYEVIESIGESGAVRRSVRPVWLSIPATIRPRRMRRRVRPAVPAASMVPALQPGAPMQPVAPVRRLAPVPRWRPVPRVRYGR
jgi:hypothetical protein